MRRKQSSSQRYPKRGVLSIAMLRPPTLEFVRLKGKKLAGILKKHYKNINLYLFDTKTLQLCRNVHSDISRWRKDLWFDVEHGIVWCCNPKVKTSTTSEIFFCKDGPTPASFSFIFVFYFGVHLHLYTRDKKSIVQLSL